MAFEHSVTVRFYEIDRAGIAFFGRFFEYCHATLEEMLAAAFGGMENIFAKTDWLMPLVHSEADFKKPVRMGDVLNVTMNLARLGSSSATFDYDITCNGANIARVRLVHACIDRTSFAPRDLPRELIDAMASVGLSPLEQGGDSGA